MRSMKFGGHETFFIRPNWLPKGLFLLQENDDVTWASNEASDAMGVGRNMSKSIGWWLNALGLSERPDRNGPLKITPLGRVLLERDPYLIDVGSWWFLHLSLSLNGVNNVFSWFFQSSRDTRFKRSELIEALKTNLDAHAEKTPALKSLQRDIAVLLQSYAKPVPAPATDPENNSECPFRRLGLLVFQSELDHYDRRAPKVTLPPHVIAAALSLSNLENINKVIDIDLGSEDGGRVIARALNLDADSFARMVDIAERTLGSKLVSTRFLAGDRVATVQVKPLEYWAEAYFKSATKRQNDNILEAVL